MKLLISGKTEAGAGNVSFRVFPGRNFNAGRVAK